MRMLVTGGAGFIGSHIQDRLISLGHDVAVLDNLRSGKKENLNPKTEFFEVSIASEQDVLKTFEKFRPDVVFHLAAQNEVPYSMDHPDEDLQLNIHGTLNLLLASQKTGVKKFIYTNTGGAYYGQVQESDLPITEDFPVVNPTSYYGVSKAAAEQYVKLFHQLCGLNWVSLRYSNVYGPRQAGNKEAGIIAIFTTKMLHGETPHINGDGLHSRDYVYVDDVVDANIAALNYDKNDYFNIATSTRITNNQVYETLESFLKTGKTPEHGPDRPGDARHISLSYEKAKKLLNWSPKTDLVTGVRQTIEFYKNH